MRSRKAEMLAQKMYEKRAVLDIAGNVAAVHDHLNLRHSVLPRLVAAKRIFAGPKRVADKVEELSRRRKWK
jgi:hypothetical protein